MEIPLRPLVALFIINLLYQLNSLGSVAMMN